MLIRKIKIKAGESMNFRTFPRSKLTFSKNLIIIKKSQTAKAFSTLKHRFVSNNIRRYFLNVT